MSGIMRGRVNVEIPQMFPRGQVYSHKYFPNPGGYVWRPWQGVWKRGFLTLPMEG